MDCTARLSEHACPVHMDLQDPQLAEQHGINKGFEVARDYAEKTEDVLGPSA